MNVVQRVENGQRQEGEHDLNFLLILKLIATVNGRFRQLTPVSSRPQVRLMFALEVIHTRFDNITCVRLEWMVDNNDSEVCNMQRELRGCFVKYV